MRSKQALKNFIFWVSIAIIVNLVIFLLYGGEIGLQFLSGYLVELSLSVDNLFLFLIIFTTFSIPANSQQRVLNYGIYGAIVLRFIFILLGLKVINRFHWLLYIFGIFLLLSGLKIILDSETSKDFTSSKLLKFINFILPVTDRLEGDRFIVRRGSKLFFTPLFVILLLIESTDIIFALDSIPAIFSITNNQWIIYISNILAILGLRSLYYLLAKLHGLFKWMKFGVAFILIFTGLKLTILFFNITISTFISLLIILIILLSSILLSLIFD